MIKNWLRAKIEDKRFGTDFDILVPPNPEMGDYSVNLAFVLAKNCRSTEGGEKQHRGNIEEGGSNENPKKIGERLVERFRQDEEFKKYFSKMELAGSGFINFYLSDDFLRNQLTEVLNKKESFGLEQDKKFKINLEFVSANPTGPLTVGNARAASYGDTLANVLKRAGYDVAREYYINDTGVQVGLLGESVARRYLRLKGQKTEFPDNLYQGEYITDIAKEMNEEGIVSEAENFDKLVEVCREYSLKKLVDSAKKSLADLGINYEVWFSESKLRKGGEVENTLKILEKGRHVYEKDGAKWLKMDNSGEHDAVLVKSDGSFSYLMGDIAYTRNKFIRGFDKAINIWGSDHYGDVLRLLAGIKALGYEDDKLEVLLHQLVFLKKGDERQRMSKRKGEFVLLDELLRDVGKDTVRFFFLMKDLNTHMEFDIDLAKEQSKKNPVYYIQYANARLNQIFAKSKVKAKVHAEELQRESPQQRARGVKETNLNLLKEPEELLLMRKMVKFPELIEEISKSYQVHHLARYALELAGDFHNFYEKHRVVQSASPSGGDDKKLEQARLALCSAVKMVLGTCLALMGISAPEKM